MTTFLQLITVGLSTGSVFAVVGVSLVLIYRTTGIVNFAQGIFAVLGALLTFQFDQWLPLWLAGAVAIFLAAVAGSLLAVLAFGFSRRTTALASLIITLGASFIAEAALLLAFGDIPRSYPGITDHAWNIENVLVQPQYVLIAAVALLAAIGLTLFLHRTIVGQALVACSDSRRAAELVGLNIRSIAVVAFVVAAGLSALAGVLLAPSYPMTYASGVTITVNGFAAAVFGGLTSIRLALLGGYVLGILEQLVVGYVDSQYSLVIALVIMLVFIGWRSRRETAVAHHVGLVAARARRQMPAAVRIGLLLGAAAFACWLPFQLSTFDLGLYDRMGLYTLVTIGLTLLTGFAGQISLGQGAFFLIGAYTSAVLTVGIDPAKRFVDPGAGIDPLLAVLAAPVLTGIVAAAIGVPLLRLRGHYLAFATLALSLIAYGLLYAQDRFTGGQYGIAVTKPLEIAGREIRGPWHAAVVWGLVAVALLAVHQPRPLPVRSRAPGDRGRRGIRFGVGSRSRLGQAAPLRLLRRARGARRWTVHVLLSVRLTGLVPRHPQHPVRGDDRRRRPRQRLRGGRRHGRDAVSRARAPAGRGAGDALRLGAAVRRADGLLTRRVRRDPLPRDAVLPARARARGNGRDGRARAARPAVSVSDADGPGPPAGVRSS